MSVDPRAWIAGSSSTTSPRPSSASRQPTVCFPGWRLRCASIAWTPTWPTRVQFSVLSPRIIFHTAGNPQIKLSCSIHTGSMAHGRLCEWASRQLRISQWFRTATWCPCPRACGGRNRGEQKTYPVGLQRALLAGLCALACIPTAGNQATDAQATGASPGFCVKPTSCNPIQAAAGKLCGCRIGAGVCTIQHCRFRGARQRPQQQPVVHRRVHVLVHRRDRPNLCQRGQWIAVPGAYGPWQPLRTGAAQMIRMVPVITSCTSQVGMSKADQLLARHSLAGAVGWAWPCSTSQWTRISALIARPTTCLNLSVRLSASPTVPNCPYVTPRST